MLGRFDTDCCVSRCPRNCFDCPICTAPLSVSSLNPDPATRSITGPFILSCGYCNWSSQDIGWQFEKLSNIQAQIAKLGNPTSSDVPEFPKSPGTPSKEEQVSAEGPDALFKQLKSFYNSQLSKTVNADPLLTPSGGYNYSSPANLMRIMSIYNNGKTGAGKKGSYKSETMRESADESEGLRVVSPDHEAHVIERLRTKGWSSTASLSQQSRQRHPARFVSDLRPSSTLLRTKRNKRCRTCRHILVKPEPKVQTTRFRIRLLANLHIPTLTLTPLHPSPSTNLPTIVTEALPVLRPAQFLLTLKNPLYEPVKVNLATPPQTPGKYGHKITILCPEFDIGANIDKWDEALGDGKSKRSSRILLPSALPARPEYVGGEGGKVAEAGKVWEKGKNWTGVVVEVVCSPVNKGREVAEGEEREDPGQDEEQEEDEDILEIPIFIRIEWEGDIAAEGGGSSQIAGAKAEGKEKRELAYWTVLGVGKVGKL